MIGVKGYRSGNPNPLRTKGFRSPKENRERPCPSRLVSYHNQQNCRVGKSKIRKQNSNRPETSPIVNGGHYMTRGHVILGQLYIKISRMSRTILERKTNPFGRENGPAPTLFSLLHPLIRSHPSARRCRHSLTAICVFFATSRCGSGPFYLIFRPLTRTAAPDRSGGPGKDVDSMMHRNLLYSLFYTDRSALFGAGRGPVAPGKSAAGMGFADWEGDPLWIASRGRTDRNSGLTSPAGGVSYGYTKL